MNLKLVYMPLPATASSARRSQFDPILQEFLNSGEESAKLEGLVPTYSSWLRILCSKRDYPIGILVRDKEVYLVRHKD